MEKIAPATRDYFHPGTIFRFRLYEELIPATRDYFHPGTIFRFRLYEEIVPATQDYLHRPPRGSKLILAVKIEMAASSVFSKEYILMLLLQCSSFLACRHASSFC